MKIVSNCPLCEEHSLHAIGDKEAQTQQCINCGYVTANKFIGTKKDNEMYKTLPEEMQSWSKEANGMIWIPSMITLPFGTLYPTNAGGEMKWGFAEMVDIPEDEQKDYPIEGVEEGYYTQRYDTENAKIYDVFLDAMVEMNKRAKADGPTKIST
tara:strand:+ start:615 stop:1076 length:462 start_codon:yes stop_codon:yes gene_type:complete